VNRFLVVTLHFYLGRWSVKIDSTSQVERPGFFLALWGATAKARNSFFFSLKKTSLCSQKLQKKMCSSSSPEEQSQNCKQTSHTVRKALLSWSPRTISKDKCREP
jgi:hypothetical protein